MMKKLNLPPKAPRYRSLIRLQRFIKNPIPFMNENLAKYGDTYNFNLRYNKVNILTTNPDVIQHILRKNCDNYEKPIAHTDALGGFVGKGLLLATGDYHTQQRGLMAPQFRPNQMGNLIQFMQSEMDDYLEELDNRLTKNPVIELNEEMRKMTFRVMANAIFSESIDRKTIEKFAANFGRLQDFFVTLVRMPSLIKWFNFTGETKKRQKLADENNQILADIITDRRKNPKEYDDLLDMLFSAKYQDTGKGMTNEQLQQESLTLFVAGHETASNILSWIFYLLHQHPDAAEKIKKEAENVSQGNEFSFEAVKKMKYLGQVMDESLRLYPPSWITDRIAKEDDEVEGFDIPKGSRVIPFIYGLHHSEKLWEDPEIFRPERFTPEARKKRHNFAYMPFGAGPRMCIGRHFATLEIKLIILKMLQKYDLELVKNQKIEILPMVTLKPRYGIKMKLKTRK